MEQAIEMYTNMIHIVLISSVVIVVVALISIIIVRRKMKQNMKMICTNCGNKIDKDSKYCKYCGIKINSGL